MKQIGGDSIRVVHPLFQEDDDGSIPISPLQLEISRVDTEKARNLNQLWHSRLPSTPAAGGYVSYAAIYKNRYYAVALWSTPIAREFNGKGYFELRRMAIAPDAPKNTASRMLSMIRKLIRSEFKNIVKLISYQDTAVHSGTIYKASGWTAAYYRDRGRERGWESRHDGSVTVTKTEEGNNSPKIRWEYDLV